MLKKSKASKTGTETKQSNNVNRKNQGQQQQKGSTKQQQQQSKPEQNQDDGNNAKIPRMERKLTKAKKANCYPSW